MATVKEIRDELDALKASAVEEKEETRKAREETVKQRDEFRAGRDEALLKLQTLSDQFEEWKAGSKVTQEDLDGIHAAIKDVQTTVEDITVEDTPSPDTPPVINPV